MYAIGLDIGTTSVCGILHNAKTGEIVCSRTLANDTFLPTDNSFEKIQDPARLLTLVDTILQELLSKRLSITSIGVTGQMHGIVYIDKDGKPVSPLAIWQDGRGDQLYQYGKTYAEYMSEKSGYALATGYGAVTYFYDTVNSRVPSEAVGFCTIHDLAVLHLTGKTNPVLHSSDAASLGLFDTATNTYDKVAVEALGLDYEMFPQATPDFEVMGQYNGIPVCVAIGDNQASVLGSVADPEHSLLVNVGTGSQISCFTDKRSNNKELDCRPLMRGSYLLAGSSLCGGRAYAMLEKLFREIATAISGTEIKSAYPAMDKLMEGFVSSADPLKVSTLFSGTRANPKERGGIANIGVDNLTMAALCDGFMQGIADELYELYEAMRPELSTERNRMVGSGNGVRNNKVLRQRFEKTFGFKMVIPAHREEAAFGASLSALVAAGVYDSMQIASKLIQYEE